MDFWKKKKREIDMGGKARPGPYTCTGPSPPSGKKCWQRASPLSMVHIYNTIWNPSPPHNPRWVKLFTHSYWVFPTRFKTDPWGLRVNRLMGNLWVELVLVDDMWEFLKWAEDRCRFSLSAWWMAFENYRFGSDSKEWDFWWDLTRPVS